MNTSIHDELIQAIQQFALKRDKRFMQKVQADTVPRHVLRASLTP